MTSGKRRQGQRIRSMSPPMALTDTARAEENLVGALSRSDIREAAVALAGLADRSPGTDRRLLEDRFLAQLRLMVGGRIDGVSGVDERRGGILRLASRVASARDTEGFIRDARLRAVARRELDRMGVVPASALAEAFLDLGGIPDSGRIAPRLAVAYERMGTPGWPDARDLATAALDRVGFSAVAPERRAAADLAAAAESGARLAYHGPQHTREVLVNALILVEGSDRLRTQGERVPCLSATDKANQVLAALAHDLLHDGRGNMVADGTGAQTRVPYRLERRSADFASAVMQRAGVAPGAIAAVRCLVLATDPTGAHEQIREALSCHARGLPPASLPEPELMPLFGDARLAAQAAIMSDADLLSSGGLSARYHAIQCRRLGEELGCPVGAGSTLYFVDKVVGGSFLSPAGKEFNPVLLRIRETAANQVARQDRKMEILQAS